MIKKNIFIKLSVVILLALPSLINTTNYEDYSNVDYYDGMSSELIQPAHDEASQFNT